MCWRSVSLLASKVQRPWRSLELLWLYQIKVVLYLKTDMNNCHLIVMSFHNIIINPVMTGVPHIRHPKKLTLPCDAVFGLALWCSSGPSAAHGQSLARPAFCSRLESFSFGFNIFPSSAPILHFPHFFIPLHLTLYIFYTAVSLIFSSSASLMAIWWIFYSSLHYWKPQLFSNRYDYWRRLCPLQWWVPQLCWMWVARKSEGGSILGVSSRWRIPTTVTSLSSVVY